MKKALSAVLAAVLFSLCLNVLHAAENPAAPEKDSVRNAISVQPLGAILNSYFFNFEHLFAGRHGAVLEAGFVGYYKFNLFSGGSKSAAWNIEQGYTLALHYRFHFFQKMNSPFIGIFGKYGSLAGTITGTSDESKMLPSSPSQPRIGFVSTYKILGINAGYRWVFDSGLTLVLRLGAGIDSTQYKYSISGYQDEKDIFRGFFGTFLSIDTEVSVGYAF